MSPAKQPSSQHSPARLVPVERVEQAIYLIRGKKVMLDEDLANLYGVETRILTRAVRRNLERFPEDFAFPLTLQEFRNLKSQTGISSWGGRRKPPWAFTEQGIAMLSGLLRSPQAVQANIQIMRVFVRLRELMLTHRDLASKLAELEKKHQKHEKLFASVFDAIRKLLEPTPAKRRPRIGFHSQGSSQNR